MISTETFKRNCENARKASIEAREEQERNLRDLTALCALTGYKHNGPGASVAISPSDSYAYAVAGCSPHQPLTVFDDDGNTVISGPVDEVLFMLVED